MAEEVWTKSKLEGFIAEIVGRQFAEVRHENEARSNASDDITKALARFVSGGRGPSAEVDSQADPRGMKGARFLRAMAAGRGNPDAALAFAKSYYKDGIGEDVIKALGTTTGTGGGFIVPPAYSEEIIELLYNKTVVRALGAQTMPMPSGAITIPKVSSGATAEYVGENLGSNASAITLGSIGLSFKKLRVTVPISNDLLMFSKPSADSVVRNDLVNGFRVKEDATFLRSVGTQFSPKGLLYWCPSGNKENANATVNLANVTADLGKLVLKLEEANIPFIRPGWVFAPRTRNYLMTVRDGNGNYAFRPEMLQGTLWGWPFRATNQVPKNLGTGNDESEIYLADFNDVVIGESSDMSIDTSTEAAYLDESGNLTSAFANDQTVLRVIARHDLGVRRPESIAMLQQVKWI